MRVFASSAALTNLNDVGPAAIWSTPTGNPSDEWESTAEGNAGARVFAGAMTLRLRPKFQLSREASFFCSGSCFARNVEMALTGLGSEVLSRADDVPHHWMHRYNTFSIARDYRAAVEGFSPDSFVWVEKKGQWYDFAGYGSAATKEELQVEKERVVELHRSAFGADVILVTLGLVEAWFDLKTNEYLNLRPSFAVNADPDRYELRVTSYAENLQALEAFRDFMVSRAERAPRFVVTVSPVPLSATFTGTDVVQANAYSKAVLRAVAQDWADRHEDVDYFPSYELVTHSDPDVAWFPDHRHVRPDFVAHIMREFIQAYLP